MKLTSKSYAMPFYGTIHIYKPVMADKAKTSIHWLCAETECSLQDFHDGSR